MIQGRLAPLGLGQGSQRAPQLLLVLAGRLEHTFRKSALSQADGTEVLSPCGHHVP